MQNGYRIEIHTHENEWQNKGLYCIEHYTLLIRILAWLSHGLDSLQCCRLIEVAFLI